jgi:hypothetical protein
MKSGWSIAPTPNPNVARASELFGVACTTSTTCTAVGNFADRTGALLSSCTAVGYLTTQSRADLPLSEEYSRARPP